MTPEERLLRAIFGYKAKFKNKKDEEQYELNCLTIPGYEELWRLMSYVPKEDRNFVNDDFMRIQATLVHNYNKLALLELYVKRILRFKELNMPKIIEENEYRVFFEKVVELFKIELTKEEIEEVHKPIPDDVKEKTEN